MLDLKKIEAAFDKWLASKTPDELWAWYEAGLKDCEENGLTAGLTMPIEDERPDA